MKYNRLNVEIEFDTEWTWGAICGSSETSRCCINKEETILFANNLISEVDRDWPVPNDGCIIKTTVKEDNGCCIDMDYFYGKYKKEKGFIED